MRIGFIGAGGIASNYLRSLARLQQPIIAVSDINSERGAAVAREQTAAHYANHREMLRREKLDAVFIAIPPGAHTTEVRDAAAAGAAVFVAKPVALDMGEALKTLEAIRSAGVINQVGYMARYSDIAEQAKVYLGDRSPTLGFGRFLCRMGSSHPWWGKRAVSGGQMVEQSTRVFDVLRHFLGDVEAVQAFGHTGAGDDIADFPDSTVCNLSFRAGAAGSVISTCIARAPEGFVTELSGRDFYLKLIHDTHLTGHIDGEPVDFVGEETGYFRQVELFLRAAREKDQELVRSSYADGVRTLAVTLAANRSLESGQVEPVEAP